jgi:hypothetical protein
VPVRVGEDVVRLELLGVEVNVVVGRLVTP